MCRWSLLSIIQRLGPRGEPSQGAEEGTARVVGGDPKEGRKEPREPTGHSGKLRTEQRS